ncbi:MAG: DUF4019 domain-containing protein [Betaproteobacteria bacterium]
MKTLLTRRAVLALLASLAWAPGAALAQDPHAVIVQKVARDWLVLADNLDADATWKAAGVRFQKAITAANWADSLKKARGARGTVIQRAVAGSTFASTFPGLPAGGTYALVRFRTSFSNPPSGSEDVTLEIGPDSTWRVIGYTIH